MGQSPREEKKPSASGGTALYLGYGDAVPDESAAQAIIEFFRENDYAAELYLWKSGESTWPLCDFLSRSYSQENYGFYEKYGSVYKLEDYPFQDTELKAPLDGLICSIEDT